MDKYILHIDTASTRGLVMLSIGGIPIALRAHSNPMEHAAFVQPAIAEIMAEAGVDKSRIGAIAVANGPGSYTGLRVGLASAKGLCFSWKIPLITLSSLKIMAAAIRHSIEKFDINEKNNIILSPMIDARRMEVFFALYHNQNLATLSEPSAAILDDQFLAEILEKYIIYFAGDGAAKWQHICLSSNARFLDLPDTEFVFAQEAYCAAQNEQMANISYAEPFYTKAFYSTSKKIV